MINSKINSTLEFDKNVKWLKGERNSPASYCSENCFVDETQEEIPTFDFNCCWECKSCHKLQIVLNNTCVNGPEGWVPNTNRTGWGKTRTCVSKMERRLIHRINNMLNDRFGLNTGRICNVYCPQR